MPHATGVDDAAEAVAGARLARELTGERQHFASAC